MPKSDSEMYTRRKYTAMAVDEVVLSHHPHLISFAENGNYRAAQILMADASILLQHGLALPEPLGTYIGEALYKAALFDHSNGLPVDKAFNIKLGRGRDKINEIFKAHLICIEVQLEWLSCQRYETSSKGELGAYERVADRYQYKDPDSVRKSFEKHHEKWGIKGMTEEQLREIMPALQRIVRLPDK